MTKEKKISDNDTIYFSMNVPDWFMNESSLKDKCDVVKNLAKELENEKPITPQQRAALLSIRTP